MSASKRDRRIPFAKIADLFELISDHFKKCITPIQDGSGNCCLSINKAKNELGFTSQVSFEEGIRRTIFWYKENHLI